MASLPPHATPHALIPHLHLCQQVRHRLLQLSAVSFAHKRYPCSHLVVLLEKLPTRGQVQALQRHLWTTRERGKHLPLLLQERGPPCIHTSGGAFHATVEGRSSTHDNAALFCSMRRKYVQGRPSAVAMSAWLVLLCATTSRWRGLLAGLMTAPLADELGSRPADAGEGAGGVGTTEAVSCCHSWSELAVAMASAAKIVCHAREPLYHISLQGERSRAGRQTTK